jgi:Protein of unknown function (DUF1353)
MLKLSGPDEHGLFTLVEPVTFDLSEAGTLSLQVVVPSGFVTDFASIPAVAQIFKFDKFGKHNLAALLHDYMYASHVVNFEVANAIFYAALRRAGISPWRAKLMALAVQFGGKRSYQTGPERMASYGLK